MNNDYNYIAKQIKEMIGILLDLQAFDREDIDNIISIIAGETQWSRDNPK